MKLEYIGLKKDGERAFQDITGIEWMPGSVHEVEDRNAHKLLDHPTIWRIAAVGQVALSGTEKPAPAAAESSIPSWALKGIEAGLSDEQLEGLAQVGGPDTKEGATMWLDLTGKAYGNVEPPAPQSVIRLPDGMTRILDGLSKEALHDLAKELQVKVHPASGAAKLIAALQEAFPVKTE